MDFYSDFETGKRKITVGLILVIVFAVFTGLVQSVDVQPLGVNGTDIGFYTLNYWFHKLCGVHMVLYTITDWLGLVPVFICVMFGVFGCVQMLHRKSLLRVDLDILLLGGYYLLVILGYLLFEMFPINYRPVLIEGRLEASYPSSTTLLVLSVMPTLRFQAHRRLQSMRGKHTLCVLTILFSLFMVAGRWFSGVHWFTDIIGSVLLSRGLFCMYRAAVLLCCQEER